MKYMYKYGENLEIGAFHVFIYLFLSLIEQNFDFVQCYISVFDTLHRHILVPPSYTFIQYIDF